MKTTILKISFLALLLSQLGSCGYNDMVQKREEVGRLWSNIEADYQRRNDLIENLVETVKGEAKFEKSTLTDIANARASATQIKIDPTNATPEQLMKYQEAQGQLGMAIGRLLSVSENYPNLKTNTSFQELRNQWEQTENRINTARVRYNDAVGTYNTTIKTFPNNMLAGTFGFTEKPYFKSDPGASKAPKAKFD